MISDRKIGVYGGWEFWPPSSFMVLVPWGFRGPGLGEFLILLNSLLVVGVGILFYLLIKDSQPGAALVYLASRLIEGVFLALGGIFLFLQREVPGPLGPSFSNWPTTSLSRSVCLLWGLAVWFFSPPWRKAKGCPTGWRFGESWAMGSWHWDPPWIFSGQESGCTFSHPGGSLRCS
jgi:hypothetical protein